MDDFLLYNNRMGQHPDVLIVGGGIIGLTTAYFLARDGARVQIVDKGDLGQEASWAGAGILPAGNPAKAQSPHELLRANSIALLPALSTELRERTGVDNGYVHCGGLEFASEHSEEWRAEGTEFEEIDEPAVIRLEPAVAPGTGKIYVLPHMAQLRNPRHLKALIAACQDLGVGLHPWRPVHAFERKGGRVTSARTVEGPLHAGAFLIAAGSWTDSLLEPSGWRPGVRPIRGQMVLLNPGRPLFQRVLCRGPRYIVPRPDGRVLVGSTEEDVGFDKRTTAAALCALLCMASELVPALARAPLERCWAGLRPGSPDGLPFIGPVPGIDNLLVAAGHFRSGIQLSAGTALLLKQHLLGQPLTMPLTPFRLDRAGKADVSVGGRNC